MKIGIIGQGFVGNAVKAGFERLYDVLTYDKYKDDRTNASMEKIVSECQIIFVCLPTPMIKELGWPHLKIVEDTLKELDKISATTENTPVVVVKSTVLPGSCALWSKRFYNITIVFNPEFLTEANAVDDFLNQSRIILGASQDADLRTLIKVFDKTFPHAFVLRTTHSEAEMIKYATNCFLAVKVSFANEIYDVCEKLDIDYDKVISGVALDERVGQSHWKVPGPDGHRGFGGSCFPKDLNALMFACRTRGVEVPVLEGAWTKNLEVRPERDWESLEGRAVLNSEKSDTL
jgi:UDPglucose 6-dehydrogenase